MIKGIYKALELEIFKSEMSKSEIAEKAEIKYNTFIRKLKAGTFSLDEALKIRKVINSTMTVEELFKKSA